MEKSRRVQRRLARSPKASANENTFLSATQVTKIPKHWIVPNWLTPSTLACDRTPASATNPLGPGTGIRSLSGIKLAYTRSHFPGLERTYVKTLGQRGKMATAVARPSTTTKDSIDLPGSRYDHYFFSAMALAMLTTVFVGFAHTYYLAGVFRAPLPSLTIHLHGAAFTCWILLLVTQTSFVAAGRVDLHRRLGMVGFLLAGLMVILGVLAATDSLARASGPAGRDVQFFYIVPLTDMLIFAVLTFFAFRARRTPQAHKRLIIVATIGLLIAAIARWPITFLFRNAAMAALLSYIFLIALVTYDLWISRKVHRATLWAGGFLILVQQIRIPIGKTAAWHTVASWVQLHAR